MEYISNSRWGSYKQGKPLFMDTDTDDEQHMDKKGKNITLENLKFEQVRKWVLSCFDGVEEWKEKHKKYLDEQLRASRGRGVRSKVKPMGFIPWLRQQLENDKMSTLKRMLISSGRRSMSSDQMEDFYNLVHQRASTSPGLLRKRKAITLNEVRQAVGDKSTKFSTRIGEIARNIFQPGKVFQMRSEDPETARTNYFLAGHTYSDGYFLTPFIKAKVRMQLEKVRERKMQVHITPQRHEWEVGIHFLNFHRDEVVVVGRAIFPRNQTNNPNEYDVLVDLVIDEDAEISGRRGMLFHNIPVGEWFKYPSFLLKIIDEKMNPLRDEVATKCAQDNNETEQTKVRLMRANVEKQDPSAKDVDDLLIRRFLRSHKLDIEKTSTHFLKYLEWRTKFVPNGSISESEIPYELGQNKVFLSGWDKTRDLYRLSLVADMSLPKAQRELWILGVCLMVYSLDKICASMSRPNELFVSIVDLEGWGYKNCDIRGYIGCLAIMQVPFKA
ncbi:hypothetical protein GIB67_034133 [Kingdonia uniflora]|uniref:Uncharacterized protein n=1 Tax=Kingdonia uniflora TaxID=39325 RepID=A0A7J7L6H3_9MAGN|nr:hypothetical protein GIB67_034133 [Kingdonia uniflora]